MISMFGYNKSTRFCFKLMRTQQSLDSKNRCTIVIVKGIKRHSRLKNANLDLLNPRVIEGQRRLVQRCGHLAQQVSGDGARTLLGSSSSIPRSHKRRHFGSNKSYVLYECWLIFCVILEVSHSPQGRAHRLPNSKLGLNLEGPEASSEPP